MAFQVIASASLKDMVIRQQTIVRVVDKAVIDHGWSPVEKDCCSTYQL
jgi:hypothetical protein